MRVVFLPRYAEYGASSRYRHYFLAEYLKSKDYNVVVYPFFYFKDYKAILYPFYFIFRVFVLLRFRNANFYIEADPFPYLRIPYTPKSYIIDFDDPVWLWDRVYFGLNVERKWNALVKNASLLVSGSYCTLNLWKETAGFKIVYAPTSFSKDFYPVIETRTDELIGCWIGSPSTSKHIDILFNREPSLLELKWNLVGYKGPLEGKATVTVLPWSKISEINAAKNSSFAISPLYGDSEEVNFKCGFKIVQFLALGLPTFVNNSGANRFFLEYSGVVKVDTSWHERIRQCYFYEGRLIRNEFEEKLSTDKVFPVLKRSIEDVWN